MTARTLIESGEADVRELWLLYFANGGNAMDWEFEGYLDGLMEPPALDLDLLAITLRDAGALSAPPRRRP